MKYISASIPWDDERILEFVERQRRHYADLGYCFWKLFVKGEPELAGFCGLQPLDDLPGVEIGWWLATKHWGKGIAKEAGQRAMKDSFDRCGLKRIVAIAQRENRASTRINGEARNEV